MTWRVALLVLGIFAGSCATNGVATRDDLRAVNAALDDFNQAASVADEARYFSHFAPDGVFLGTDASERWTVDEFRKFVHPYFSQNKGWTYVPKSRHFGFSPDHQFAWFDEALDNASYGECRGTGAMRKINGEWKIEQYNLMIPIPNSLAKEIVKTIREASPKAP